MGNLEVLEEYDVHVIAFLTIKGWVMCGDSDWTKEGKSIKDCTYHDTYECSGCTDSYDRTYFTRDEAHQLEMEEQDAPTTT